MKVHFKLYGIQFSSVGSNFRNSSHTVDIVLQDSGAVSATSDAGAETETDGEASSRWAVIGGDLVT